MKNQPTPREAEQCRTGTRRTTDRWLWISSLVFHLIVFMLLPTFVIEAKQPLQLLIEIVRPEVKPQPKPAKQVGVRNPLPAAKDNPPTPGEQAAKLKPSQLQESPREVVTKPIQSTRREQEPIPDQPTAGAAIPEMVAVPTFQPQVVPAPAEPVVDEPQTEPAPAKVASPPAAATGTGNSLATPRPAEAQGATPEPPANPVKGLGEPGTQQREPTGDTSGQPALGEAEAGPPGPSALELGLLGEYGDGARKKIRMLVRTPELAREQGLQGKCKFEFELRSDGTLVGIKIIESSSQAVLDEECLEATRVAAPFKRFPIWVSVASWKFQMEIVFPTY